jgi:hypothetical protein
LSGVVVWHGHLGLSELAPDIADASRRRRCERRVVPAPINDLAACRRRPRAWLPAIRTNFRHGTSRSTALLESQSGDWHVLRWGSSTTAARMHICALGLRLRCGWAGYPVGSPARATTAVPRTCGSRISTAPDILRLSKTTNLRRGLSTILGSLVAEYGFQVMVAQPR